MAWPMIAAAGIGAVGSIAGGLIGASGGDKSYRLARNQLREILKAIYPYRQAGEWGLNVLRSRLQKGPGKFDPEQEPGYLYGYKRTVEDPITRAASVRGRLYDPSTQLELGRAASDYAETKYDNWLNRYYQKLQPFANLATQGAQVSAQQGQIGANILPQMQAGQTDKTNSLLAMVNSLSNTGGKALDYYQTSQMLAPQNRNVGYNQNDLYKYLMAVK